MDGYMLLQRAVSQRGWQRKTVWARIATRLWRNAVEKAVLQVRQRWAAGTALGVWRGQVQAPGNSIRWSLRRRKGHKGCLKCGKPCPAPLAHGAGDPEKGAHLLSSCADLMRSARSGCTLDVFCSSVYLKYILCPCQASWTWPRLLTETL